MLPAASIVKLLKGHPVPMEILLIADECVEAIERYIYQCDVYVLWDAAGRQMGVFALHHNSPEELELKNMAVIESCQGHGLGGYMLAAIERIAATGGYRRIIVGTATVGRQLNFYKKNGFIPVGARKNFFLENYPQPIFEDGQRLCDMVLLEKMIMQAGLNGRSERV